MSNEKELPIPVGILDQIRTEFPVEYSIILLGLFKDLKEFEPIVTDVNPKFQTVKVRFNSLYVTHTIKISSIWNEGPKYACRYNIHTENIPEGENLWWLVPPSEFQPNKAYHVYYAYTDKIVNELRYQAESYKNYLNSLKGK